HHEAYNYISRYFEFLSEARVSGELYDMGQYPAAIPADSGATIIGELYQVRNLDEFEWAMAQLDEYEGVTPDEDEPQLYCRDLVRVYFPDGSSTEAWIYWFNGDTTGRPRVGSGDILHYRAGTK